MVGAVGVVMGRDATHRRGAGRFSLKRIERRKKEAEKCTKMRDFLLVMM